MLEADPPAVNEPGKFGIAKSGAPTDDGGGKFGIVEGTGPPVIFTVGEEGPLEIKFTGGNAEVVTVIL